MELHDKIFVAGHRGLVGSAIVKYLVSLGYNNLQLWDRSQLDLADACQVEKFFQDHSPDYVFDAAAKVGGIHSNNTHSAEFIYQNTQIQNNLIHNSWKYGVKKFLFLGSVCIYPKFAPVPVRESSLLTGELEPTNEAYAMAKIHGIKMCQAYHKQYGFRSVCIMPSNLYGENDNFNTENGHVIPAMMQKFYNDPHGTVTLWGDGSPHREFLHCDDMASACVFLMQHTDTGSAELVNAGGGENVSIRELSEILAKITGFTGNIVWDTSRPNGTPNRPLDSGKILSMGWQPRISLPQGLQHTYRTFVSRQQMHIAQSRTRK
jgi:GDP-L-fucose synthase